MICRSNEYRVSAHNIILRSLWCSVRQRMDTEKIIHNSLIFFGYYLTHTHLVKLLPAYIMVATFDNTYTHHERKPRGYGRCL